MKRFVLAASLALGLCHSLPAQQSLQPQNQLTLASAALPSAPSLGAGPLFTLAPAPAAPSSSFASPAPPPVPQFPSSHDDFYRWDLGVGYELLHFKSAPFSANLSGLHTDLTYNFKDWLGVEGSLVSAWGGKVLGGETSKAVLFTGGVRIGEGYSRHRWTPWGHALIGGIHMWPQVAGQGRVSFAVQAGGGADYRLNDRLSFRAEGDYVRTQLYASSQNNFQFGAGVVIHF